MGNANIRTRRSRRNQNNKKAKNYVPPNEELTRLQIRADLRLMMSKSKRLDEHGASTTNYQAISTSDAYLDGDSHDNNDDNEEDDETFDHVQFVKRKRKKKRSKKRHFDQSPSPNDTFRISANGHSHQQAMNGIPPLKKQKVLDNTTNNGSADVIKCGKCQKLFTLEVDLLLHKTNEHC